ncbi:MAG: hypothetical protein WBP55_04310 [Solirubrobacterales bacterium]
MFDPAPSLREYRSGQPGRIHEEEGLVMDFSGDGGAAMEDLRQCEADLKAYGDARGLVLRLDPAYPGAPEPENQPGPIKHCVWSLIGEMPGGVIGKLRYQSAFGTMIGVDVQGGHAVFVARQPETVAYVPLLSCRPDEITGDLFAWAGDSRKRQEQSFESLELERRFVIEIAKGQEQVWLWRLFTPKLIDWLAHETPPDFGFRLSSGSFSSECPQWRGQQAPSPRVDPEHLDLVAACGGRVAGRIRDEVLEQVGLGGVPDPRSSEANRNWTNGSRDGKLFRGLMKLVGAGGRDNSAEIFAKGNGFPDVVEPAAFHAAHIMLPLPGASTDVFAGALPGGRPGHLLWMEYESEFYGLRYYVGVTAPTALQGPDIWLDEDEIVAAADADNSGLAAETVSLARALGCGISTGDGRAAIYISSTGWEGRPSGDRIRSMIDRAESLFMSLETGAAV